MKSFDHCDNLVRMFLRKELSGVPSQIHKHRTYDEDELGNVTEYLCHDACHDLSIALAVRFSHDSILLIKDKDGFPVHSALYLGSIDSTIDGNGVATKESMIQD